MRSAAHRFSPTLPLSRFVSLRARQRLQCFLQHCRLRTTASHPPGECAIGSDEGLGSGVGGCRSLARDHCGEDEGLTLSPQLTGLLEERIPHI